MKASGRRSGRFEPGPISRAFHVFAEASAPKINQTDYHRNRNFHLRLITRLRKCSACGNTTAILFESTAPRLKTVLPQYNRPLRTEAPAAIQALIGG